TRTPRLTTSRARQAESQVVEPPGSPATSGDSANSASVSAYSPGGSRPRSVNSAGQASRPPVDILAQLDHNVKLLARRPHTIPRDPARRQYRPRRHRPPG